MSTELKYQPEDIEFILLNKEYHDLDVEQKSFVEEFVKSEDEYLLMRGTMLNIAESVHPEIDIVPAYSIKDALMEEFENGDKRAAGWWSNVKGMLFPAGQSFARKPGVQMAFVACAVVLVAVLFPWGGLSEQNNDFADNIQEGQNEMIVPSKDAILIPMDSAKDEAPKQDVDDRLELKEKDPNGSIYDEDDMRTDVVQNGVVADLKDLEFESANESLNKRYKSEVGYNKETTDKYWAAGGFATATDSTATINQLDGAISGFAFADDISSEETITKNSSSTPVEMELMEIQSVKKGRVKGRKLKSNDKLKARSSVAPGTAPAMTSSGNSVDLPKLSRSLDEDSELIDLLFTAM